MLASYMAPLKVLYRTEIGSRTLYGIPYRTLHGTQGFYMEPILEEELMRGCLTVYEASNITLFVSTQNVFLKNLERKIHWEAVEGYVDIVL